MTAHIMAAVRAGLTSRSVLADPYAQYFVRPPIRMLSRIVRTPARGLPLLRELVANVAGRTILFDQQTEAALDEGVKQVVILGAGYDSRAYRFARDGVRYVEVDSPATQSVKLQRLAKAGTDVAGVEYLAVNFETDSVTQKLSDRLNGTLPTLFLWEGVVEYLPEDAVRSTLRDLRRIAGPGSRLVFDIPHASESCHPFVNFMSRTLSMLLGEAKGLALDPQPLDELLRDEGWSIQSQYEITELYERHFKNLIRRAPTPHNYYVVAALLPSRS